MVVDRSGSMQTIQDDTIGGINAFLADQKEDPENVRFTYAQFDTEYDVVYDNIPIVEVPDITRETFQPRGSTALLDAIGKTINRTSSYITTQPEDEKPEKVVLVIVTDGHENASREFTRSAVLELIQAKQNNEDWQIIYLAANQNAIAEAQQYGIRGTHAMNYTSGPIGVQNAYVACSANVRNLKKGFSPSMDFSADQRHMSTADSVEVQQQTVAQYTAAGVDVSGQTVSAGEHPIDVVTSTKTEDDA